MNPSKLTNISTSIFTVMSQLAQENNAINLAQGFPDFESDPRLIELVAKAMRDGHNQYAPMAGDIGLRKTISNKTESLYKKSYNPQTEVTITAGATQAIFTAIAATIHSGDEVLIFTPAYDCYEPTIRLFGGVPVSVQLKSPAFQPDWHEVSKKISSKTRMIIINTPHNPSGTLFSESDMRQLEDLAVRHDLLVISDEVYEHIVFDGERHYSAAMFPKLASRSFITGSFGKTFHNTGWKMGFCIAPIKLTKEFQKVHQYNVFCVNHPIQKALATYMEDPNTYLGLSAFYQQKRDFFLSLLKNSKFEIIPSKGTYFQLLNFSKISSDGDVNFAEWLTKKHKVATIPTSVFNSNKEDFTQIRVCFAKEEKTLMKAASILIGI